MTIGQRIKARRLQCGITVDELAEKLGKNRATIYRYENGDIENLPTTILNPIAEALRTTPQYLMGWVDDPSNYDSMDDITINKELRDIGVTAKDYYQYSKSRDEDVKKENELKGVYLSLAKEAQESGINPDDIKLAIETIKQIRKSKGE